MFPSKTPALYVLQLLIIAAVIMSCIYLGVVHLHQPLALLALLALHWLPEFPLVPEPGNDAADVGDYDGTNAGFVRD